MMEKEMKEKEKEKEEKKKKQKKEKKKKQKMKKKKKQQNTKFFQNKEFTLIGCFGTHFQSQKKAQAAIEKYGGWINKYTNTVTKETICIVGGKSCDEESGKFKKLEKKDVQFMTSLWLKNCVSEKKMLEMTEYYYEVGATFVEVDPTWEDTVNKRRYGDDYEKYKNNEKSENNKNNKKNNGNNKKKWVLLRFIKIQRFRISLNFLNFFVFVI